MFTHTVGHAGKQISPQSNGILELMRSLDRPRHKRTERQDQVLPRDNISSLNDSAQTAAQNLNQKGHVSTPQSKLTDQRLQKQTFHQYRGCLAASSGDSFNY